MHQFLLNSAWSDQPRCYFSGCFNRTGFKSLANYEKHRDRYHQAEHEKNEKAQAARVRAKVRIDRRARATTETQKNSARQMEETAQLKIDDRYAKRNTGISDHSDLKLPKSISVLPEIVQSPGRVHLAITRNIQPDDYETDQESEDTNGPPQKPNIVTPNTPPGTPPDITLDTTLNTQSKTRIQAESDTDSNPSGIHDGPGTPRADTTKRFKSVRPLGGRGCADITVDPMRTFQHKIGQKLWKSVKSENLLFDVTGRDEERGPWAPFRSMEEFKLARWLIRNKATCTMVTEGFNSGILRGRNSTSIMFRSNFTLRELLDRMEEQPSFYDRWTKDTAIFFADKKNRSQEFYYRRLGPVIHRFFKQPAYKNYLAYSPEKHFNSAGKRIYSDLYTADWWHRQQALIDDNFGGDSFVIPLIFASDLTQLATTAGDHDLWPVYMTVGNLPGSLRSRPSSNAWVLVATLPVPPKNDDHLKKDKKGRRLKGGEAEKRKISEYKDNALHSVIQKLTAELNTFYCEGLRLSCADGQQRKGRPVLAGWLADYQEYNKLCHINNSACAVCQISNDQLGDNIVGTERDRFLDSAAFTALVEERELLKDALEKLDRLGGVPAPLGKRKRKGTRKPRATQVEKDEKEQLKTNIANHRALISIHQNYFKERQLKERKNAFWALPENVETDCLWKPDILHTLHVGMVAHALEFISSFLKRHGRYGLWEAAQLRVPTYQNITAPRKSFGQFKNTSGKLLRRTLKTMLPCLVIALKDPVTPSEIDEFDRALRCIRYLVDFCLLAQYKQHTEETLELMDQYLKGFHQFKAVFDRDRKAKTRAKIIAKQTETTRTRLTEAFKRIRDGSVSHRHHELRGMVNGMMEVLSVIDVAGENEQDEDQELLDTVKPLSEDVDELDLDGIRDSDEEADEPSAIESNSEAESTADHQYEPESGSESESFDPISSDSEVEGHLAPAGLVRGAKSRAQVKRAPANKKLAAPKKTNGSSGKSKATKTKVRQELDPELQVSIADCPERVRDWVDSVLKDLSTITAAAKNGISTIQQFIDSVIAVQVESALEQHNWFGMIKLHLLSHFTEYIRKFGALDPYSTETPEALHKGPKQAYKYTNKQGHVPQVIQYCTRQYAIRMRELNLVQLAKDGHWEEEIQDVMQLYASAADKRMAARNYRQPKRETPLQADTATSTKPRAGVTSSRDQPRFQLRFQKEWEEESDLDNLADEEDNVGASVERQEDLRTRMLAEINRVPEEQPIRLPPYPPLFSKDLKEDERLHPLFLRDSDLHRTGPPKVTRFFSGEVRNSKVRILKDLRTSGSYKVPNLTENVRDYLIKESTRLGLERLTTKSLSLNDVNELPAEVRTSLSIRQLAVQSYDTFETLKVLCTGEGMIRRTVRNDHILFRDTDSEGEATSKSDSFGKTNPETGRNYRKGDRSKQTDFGPYLYGKLLCLFKLSVPKDWSLYRITGGNINLKDPELYKILRFAYVRTLRGVEAAPDGNEMIPGPLVARCKWETSTKHKYRLMQVQSVVRPAQLIPEHSDSEQKEGDQCWVINNRIDQGTWDEIYGLEDPLSS